MQKVFVSVILSLLSLAAISQNPVLLKDIFPGNNSGTIAQIVKTSNYTFFNEDDDDPDTERSLFRTDGTTAGTIKLNLSYPGFTGVKAEKLTALGNKVFFAGANSANYGELWVSDGTQAGTIGLEKFQPTTLNSPPVIELNTMDGYVYYSVIDANNHAIIKRTDGTAEGTSLVYDFSSFAGFPQVVFFTPVNNILYFIVYDQGGTGVDQLWRSDGTTAGTYMVYNFTTANFVESFIMPAGNTLYIMIGSVVGGVRQNTIWKSDGTSAGTVPVKLVGTGNTNIYPPFAAIGNTLYFAGVDGNGKELWQTDGSAAGTYMVADINPGSANSNPAALTVLNNQLYFAAISASSGGELWKYSSGVASLVKDINPGAAGSGPGGLVVSNNSIIFNANNGVNGGELWITDGTSRNTVMVADINPGIANSIPNTFTPGNPVYFAANNGTNGFEVFKYDNNGDVLSGPRKFYVNDNSQAADVFTSATGSNGNNGSKAYPFATINYAITQVQAGDTIYVDAGTYAEQVTIDKGITIIGAGQNLTSIVNPAAPLVPPPGPFNEYALIQTTQNIGDVHISNLQATNTPANNGHTMLIQAGGSVKNCRVIDGSLGLYFRVESAAKTVVIENNYIQASVFAVACQGSGLTVSVINNTLNVTNPAFSVGIWVGIDFGPVAKLTATGNAITNYVYRGIVGNSSNTVLSENSILGTGQYAIENTATPAIATCNWYGTTDPAVIASKMNGSINYTPWLTSGTDNSSDNGFQPLPNFCVGGLKKLYVNDNSLSGDIYTTAVGNDNNSGASNSPLATITAALSKAIAGDTIIVDAGNYTEIVNINKNITIRGAGNGITIINGPAGPVTPYPNTGETGIIQTLNGLTDVIIEKLTVDGTNSLEQHGIFIQGGGRVSDCELRYVNDGFYFQYISTQSRTAVGTNNYVHHINYVGCLFAGNGLNATATNNVIDLNGAIFGIGFIAGYGGDGNLASFTATNNSIINFNGFGLLVGSLQRAQVHNNSITRLTGNFFQNAYTVNIDATCNWYGTSDAAVIIPNMTGDVSYSPWLSNGTDNDIAFGFQPSPVACNGRQNKLYVNDASQTGDVFTSAIGNNGNPGIPSAPLATISAAYLKASPGDTIYVDAGTYASVDGTIGKSITLLGANYLTNPNDGTNPLNAANRTAETIISNTTWTIGASDIRVKGFTFDPQAKTALAQTNNTLDYDNIEMANNIFLVKSATTAINLLGKQQQPLITVNYSITNNRFIKSVAGNGSNISMTGVDGILISGNTFTTNNSAADWTQNAFTGAGFRTNNFVISNNTAYRTRFTYQNLNAIKAQVSNNKVYETVRFLLDFNGLNIPTEVNITDNEVTIANSNGGPAISYSKSNGTDQSAPNIARIERNTITADGTAWSLVPQALVAPTIDNLSANTQVFIRDNKLTITGNFSTQSDPGNYVSAIRFLNNSRQAVVERNEIQFSATNYGTSNKFGIGILYSGLQPGTSFNFLNNKISGFPTSIGVQNNANANNYGELPAGTVLNINNNSFTGDVMSINNGTTGQDASASCNWYGSAAAQNFINKLANVSAVPWLTNGTDNDAATGFQPVDGACDGYPTLITLDGFTNVTCNGAANGTISITTSDGKAPFTYTWTKDGDANFVSHQEDPTNLTPGTYHLSIVDGNGSTLYITDPQADGPGTIDVTITEPAVLTASASGTNNICYGQLNGTASVIAEGGTTPYAYSWSNGATSAQINNLAAGVYSVTVTDANGCTASSSYTVTQPTQLTASITNNSTACSNNATVITSGGTAPYTYYWSNTATNTSISGVIAGTYSVTVTDANGCTATASVTLSVSGAFNPTASATDVTCFGANNGIITVTNANGTAPFKFSIDGVNFLPGVFPYSFTNLAPGTYTVAARDVNGCTGFVTRTISQPSQLTATYTVQNTCPGSNTGGINVTVNGGTTAYSYSWTGPGGYTSTQLNISNLAAGNYILTIKDKNNCSLIVPVTVSAYPAIVLSADITNISCKGNTNGAINITATGGTGSGFTYSWTGTAISSSEDLTNLAASNNYKLKVTDNGSGCTATATYSITEPAAITISASKTNATGCALGTVSAFGTGGTRPFLYSLNGGAFITDSVFTGLQAGSYTVTIKDANGCTKTSGTLSVTDNGQDAYESNNSKNQSKTILVGAAINARIASATDVADWFKFVTNGAGSYTITFNHPSASFVYNVYPATNNAPALVPVSSTATSKTYTLAAGTTYHISVTGGLSAVCYTLGVYDNSIITQRSPQKIQAIFTPDVNTVTTMVYPNPHHGSFGIRIEALQSGMATVEIMNLAGQRIESRKVAVTKGNNTIVRFTNMHQSALIYRVTMGDEIKTGKILSAN